MFEGGLASTPITSPTRARWCDGRKRAEAERRAAARVHRRAQAADREADRLRRADLSRPRKGRSLRPGSRILRDMLAADHPLVKQVLAGKTPEARAAELVNGTKLGDPAVRKQLFTGGAAAVKASTDPFVEIARVIEPRARSCARSTTTKCSPSNATPTRRSRKPCSRRRATPPIRTRPSPSDCRTAPSRVIRRTARRIDAVHAGSRPLRARRSTRSQAALHVARQLGQGARHARPQHSIQLRHDQRHRRRQQRVAGHQCARRARRIDLRRQHPVAAGIFHLRRHPQSCGRRRRSGHDRGAAQGVSRRRDRQRAAGVIDRDRTTLIGPHMRRLATTMRLGVCLPGSGAQLFAAAFSASRISV